MDLTPEQITRLESLLNAGFRFVTIERVERYVGLEKDGFAALLDPSGGRLSLFGQAGLRIGEGIGMLVERGEGKAFVWHGESVPAPPELLETYHRFKTELDTLLRPSEERNVVGGRQ
jgi:hypothetical protein